VLLQQSNLSEINHQDNEVSELVLQVTVPGSGGIQVMVFRKTPLYYQFYDETMHESEIYIMLLLNSAKHYLIFPTICNAPSGQ